MAVATELLVEAKPDLVGERQFEGKRILVTGASQGTGLAAAIELHKQGAEVAIGSRSREKYASALIELRQAIPSFDGERVRPFLADFSIPGSAVAALDELNKKGFIPTDIVHAAAGGMESFLMKVARGLIGLRRTLQRNPAAYEEERAALRVVIADEVQASLPAAMAVNFNGPREFLAALPGRVAPPTRVIDYASIWSTTLRNVPGFYEGIANSKNPLEVYGDENREHFEGEGIFFTVQSGDIVWDTGVGETISRAILPILPEDDRAKIEGSGIQRADMVDVTRTLLLKNPQYRASYPRRLFVFGPGEQVSPEIPEDHPAFTVQMPI